MSGSEFLRDRDDVSINCGANFLLAGFSSSSGALLDFGEGGSSSLGGEAFRRLDFVDVSIGCGANLLRGLFSPSACCRLLFADVSTG